MQGTGRPSTGWVARAGGGGGGPRPWRIFLLSFPLLLSLPFGGSRETYSRPVGCVSPGEPGKKAWSEGTVVRLLQGRELGEPQGLYCVQGLQGEQLVGGGLQGLTA